MTTYIEVNATGENAVKAAEEQLSGKKLKGVIGGWVDFKGKEDVYAQTLFEDSVMDSGAFAFGVAGLAAVATALAF